MIHMRGLLRCLFAEKGNVRASMGRISKCIIPTLHVYSTAESVIHIGKEIQAELLRQERTPAWLARKIHCQRPNIYYIFNQPSINTDLLLTISKVLNTDFFKLYTKSLQSNSTPKDQIL